MFEVRIPVRRIRTVSAAINEKELKMIRKYIRDNNLGTISNFVRLALGKLLEKEITGEGGNARKKGDIK